MKRSVVVRSALAVTAALVASVGWVGTAAAVPPAVSGPSTVKVDADYFSRERSDPMDFSNIEDLDTTANGPMIVDGTASINGGLMNVRANVFYLMRSIGNVIPTSGTRDSDLYPLHADRYRYLSFRMHSTVSGVSAMEFQTCDVATNGCKATKYFNLRQGWHTYVLDMAGGADADGHSWAPNPTASWTGLVKTLLMVPLVNGGGNYGANLTFDWVRVTSGNPMEQLSLSGGSGGQVQLAYDVGGNANDSGTIGALVSPTGSVQVPLGALPAGDLRFYAIQNGTPSARGATVRLDEPPVPVVIDPDERGGDDWATVVRGDPWDFNQLSDVWQTHNMNFVVNGGFGNGWSAGPSPNDPLMMMNTNGRNIDASTYHRASVTMRYEGPWGLESVGGGMVGRFVWKAGGSNHPQVSQDFLVSTAPRTYTFDLTTWPPNAVLDNNGAGNPQPLGWGHTGSEQVEWFRFDPHEDESPRGWFIDEIRLARNDRVAPVFDIRFADTSGEAGTTASLWADTDRNPNNGLGVPIRSGVPVQSGVNTVRWDGAYAVPGSYWVHVVLTDPGGTSSGAYATGQLDVTGPPQTAPVGTLDLATGAGPGAVRVAGWAFDPDNTNPVDIHVHVAGTGTNLGPAVLHRADITGYGYGPNHGYDATIGGLPAGRHEVCAAAINNGPGPHRSLGCRVVEIQSHQPLGSLDVAEGSGPNAIRVAGWALDPDTAAPIWVHLSVGDRSFDLGPAWRRRDDLSAFGRGPDHAFDLVISGIRAGTHRVCAAAINEGPGTNVSIGCRNVVVK